MKYLNPADGSVLDTDTQNLRELWGLLRYLIRHSASQKWVNVNGPGTITRLCRAIRVRVHKDLSLPTPIRKGYERLLNTLDPPPCACGKPGTRIVGHQTFCVTCAQRPQQRDSAKAERRAEQRNAFFEPLVAEAKRRDNNPKHRKRRARITIC